MTEISTEISDDQQNNTPGYWGGKMAKMPKKPKLNYGPVVLENEAFERDVANLIRIANRSEVGKLFAEELEYSINEVFGRINCGALKIKANKGGIFKAIIDGKAANGVIHFHAEFSHPVGWVLCPFRLELS